MCPKLQISVFRMTYKPIWWVQLQAWLRKDTDMAYATCFTTSTWLVEFKTVIFHWFIASAMTSWATSGRESLIWNTHPFPWLWYQWGRGSSICLVELKMLNRRLEWKSCRDWIPGNSSQTRLSGRDTTSRAQSFKNANMESFLSIEGRGTKNRGISSLEAWAITMNSQPMSSSWKRTWLTWRNPLLNFLITSCLSRTEYISIRDSH